MCCAPKLADTGAPQRPCSLIFGLREEGGSSRTNLQGLQGCPWTWAIASLHKRSRLHPGKAWPSPSLLMTEVLADHCTFTSTNPRGAVGFGSEDYWGENSYQLGVIVVHLLLLFSCLSKNHRELWPGLWLIPKVLTILCSTVCNHLHFGVITF